MNAPPILRLYVLGEFRLEICSTTGEWQEVPTNHWRGNGYARSILKFLVNANKRRASREYIIDQVWPDHDPEIANKHLTNAVHLIRKVFKDANGQILRTWGRHGQNGYEIAEQSVVWVDVDHCRYLLKQAETMGRTSVQAINVLNEACMFFGAGTYLQEEDGQWCLSDRAAVERLASRCQLWLAEAYAHNGHFSDAEEHYNTLLKADSTNEECLRQLLKLYSNYGMGHLAKQCVESIQQRLEEDGLQISQETLSFFETLQQRDRTDRGLLEHPAMHTLTHPARPIAQSFFVEDVLSPYSTGISACWKLYFEGNLAEVEHILPMYLQILPLAQQHSYNRQALAGLLSQAYQLASLVAKHHEDFGTALSHCKQAVIYGEMARESNLIVSALIRQVDVLFYRKRYNQILNVLQEAEKLSSQISPLLSGRIYSDLAPTFALFENYQEAARYRGLAHDTTPEHPEEDPGYLFTRSDHYILYLNDTISFLYEKKPKEALQAINKAGIVIQNAMNTHQIEILNYKTLCAVELNDMNLGIDCFKALAEATETIGSDLFQSEGRDLHQKMLMKWTNEAKVKELEGLLY